MIICRNLCVFFIIFEMINKNGMSSFYIYPHRAYLNSDIHIFADHGEEITLCHNDMEIKRLSLSDKGYGTFSRFCEPGEYQFADSKGNVETLLVEDAYRYGTSKYKNSWLFTNPDILFIQLYDRLKIYDLSKNCYVFEENDLCPDSIEQIKPNLFLFKSDRHTDNDVKVCDYSLFSTDTFSFLNSVSFNETLACVGERIVVRNRKEVSILEIESLKPCITVSCGYSSSAWVHDGWLYVVGNTDNEIVAVNIISLSNSCIAKNHDIVSLTINGIILIYNEDGLAYVDMKRYTGKIDSSNANHITSIPPEFDKISFVGQWHIKGIEVNSYSEFLAKRSEIKENRRILDSCTYKEIEYELLTADSERDEVICRTKVSLSEYSRERTGTKASLNSSTEKSFSIFNAGNVVKSFPNKTVISCTDGGLLLFKGQKSIIRASPEELNWKNDKNINNGNRSNGLMEVPRIYRNCFAIEAFYRGKNIVVAIHPSSIEASVIYTKRDGIRISCREGGGNNNRHERIYDIKLTSTGDVRSRSLSCDEKVFGNGILRDSHYCCSGDVFEVVRREELFLFVKDEKGRCYLVTSSGMSPWNRDESKKPYDRGQLIDGVSNDGTRLVVKSGGKICVCDCNGRDIHTICMKEVVYTDGIISPDGVHLIYESDNRYQMIDIESGESEHYFNSRCIGYSRDGSLIVEDVDDYRKALIMDPRTFQMVNAEDYVYYQYQSPDGSLNSPTNRKYKYYHKIDERYVSKAEYDQLISQLGSRQDPMGISTHIRPDELLKNRTRYYDMYKEYFNNRTDTKSVGFIFGKPSPDVLKRITIDHIRAEDIVERRQYITVSNNKSSYDILISDIDYINYVAFSFDNQYVGIVGKLDKNQSGGYIHIEMILYQDDKIVGSECVYKSEGWWGVSKMATWTCGFSIDGTFYTYDSLPITYTINPTIESDNKQIVQRIPHRSWLCTSKSGRYVALSEQGYEAMGVGGRGHMPSSALHVISIPDKNQVLDTYCGRNIQCHSYKHYFKKNVNMAAFSDNEKRLMTVRNDGVIYIHNMPKEDAYD